MADLSFVVHEGATARTTPPQIQRKPKQQKRPIAKTGLRFFPLLGIRPTGAGLSIFRKVWLASTSLPDHFDPKNRTTFHRYIRHSAKQARKPPLNSRLRFLLTLRKCAIGAGLPVLKVFLAWILLLHSVAQAEPETRTTTTPTTAYEPPAYTAVETDRKTPRTSAAPARTTTDLLTFIRALEAPRGYIDYERRIRIPPPKPLTTMTVGEVLDWQVRVRRSGAPSTAAGGYQIIYPTLSHLVRKHGIDRAARFNPRTQDHLARLLIAECGRKGPRGNHPRYGNCLAGIWAALPLTHGSRKGRSAHHGVAGNRALTTPETVLALLGGKPVAIGPRPPDPATALARIGRSMRSQPLAFGASRVTVETRQSDTPSLSDINTALRKARRDNTLTPPARPLPEVRTWKRDPYAQE